MFRIFALAAMALLISPSFSFAETKEIISEGTYNMGDGETPSVAESRALLKAKQIALEQAGTYVESYSKVKNITLTQDEIQVLASGLMEVEILDKKRTVVGDGINFWVKIKAKVNPDKMEEMAKRVQEKSAVEDYKKVQEAYAKSQEEIEELKRELRQSKDEKEKKKVEAKIAEDEKLFQANEWFEKGENSYYQYSDKKNYSDEAYFDEAIEAYTSAIALNGKFVEAYVERGTRYALRGKYDKAVADYSKAIDIEPNHVRAHHMRGWTYYSKREYDHAIEDYSKAITMAPEDAGTYQFRGDAYIDGKGEYDKAIEDYSKAISIYKGQYDKEKSRKVLGNEWVIGGLAGSLAWAYVGRGNAYEGKEMYDKAIVEFKNAIAVAPEFSRGYRGLGLIYSKKKQYDLAIDNFTKAISKKYSWTNAWDYYYRARAYDETGQFDKAIEDYDKAIEIDPDLVLAYVHRGNFFAMRGENDRAISDLSKALSINKNDARVKKILFKLRGSIYSLIHQHDKAIEDYNNAIALDADDPDTFYARGYSYLRLNNTTQAINDYKKACSAGLQEACKELQKLMR